MQSRVTYLFIAVAILAAMGIFALTNPSYQKAFEARLHYFMGEYDRAYELAKEAYELDSYNKMAFTVMVQTEVAKKYQDYIKEGEKYLRVIEEIADKTPINDADKVRVKLMCEVMMGKYEKLSSTKLTDKELIERANNVYEKYSELYTTLFKQK